MIHVFRTSVETEEHIVQLAPALNQLLMHPAEWNFDLEDCDRVLRITNCPGETAQHCMHTLREKGFVCEELND
jgi:hypothetical protein